jgi:hypothetical protein
MNNRKMLKMGTCFDDKLSMNGKSSAPLPFALSVSKGGVF